MVQILRVLDNASIHHTEQAVSLMGEIGTIPLFLPSYSPNIDPVIQVLNENEMDNMQVSLPLIVATELNNVDTYKQSLVQNVSGYCVIFFFFFICSVL